MAFKNIELRVYKGNIKMHEIADVLGIHHVTLSRWFNDGEMNEIRRQQVENAITEIKDKRRKEGTA